MPENIHSRLQELARKWRDKQLTEDERTELEQLYAGFDDSLLVADSPETPEELQQRLYTAILEKADMPVYTLQPAYRRLWPRIAVAASLLIFTSAGGWYLLSRHSKQQPSTATTGIVAGANKAVLTLAGGQTITLSDAANGRLAVQENTSIEKTADGAIRYAADTPGKNSQPHTTSLTPLYNTLSTPRGGQYAITLSDGTKIILNAASTLSYPTAFTGNNRTVRLSGEAWFEVAPDNQHPFFVNTKDQQVEVLGTQFNIDAYDNEPSTRTTLIAGSVKVSGSTIRQSRLLQPGQQTILDSHQLQLVRDADIEEATAWKNGYFLFQSEDIQSIMRKISRWYDVDVRFDGPQTTEKFNGSVQRLANVSEILKKLELTNKVHFNIVGRTIIVRK
ncbi:MAG: FecR domain-containing protein [Bacteroidetes bacterium]|nr:FecR domain-containing protein [Bacteroidota bacterium]